MSEESKKKNQLLSEIGKVETEASRLLNEGQLIVKNSQYIKEISKGAKKFIGAFPDDQYLAPGEWDNQIMHWKNYSASLSNTSYTIPMSLGTDSTSATATLVNLVFKDDNIQKLPITEREIARTAVNEIKNVIERSPLQEEVIHEMQRLGLENTFQGERSAITLLGEAVSSIQYPAGDEPSPTLLLALRGSIEKTLADLLRKRPRQETCKNYAEKVKSILAQCGLDSLSPLVIDQLINDVGPLHDALSSGKGKRITNNYLNELLIQSELFLKLFFQCIDAGKLRQ